MGKILLAIFSFLGSPALLAQLRDEVDYLRAKVSELEAERLKLQDSFLIQRGATPLNPEPLPPPVEQKFWMDEQLKADIKDEVEELIQLVEVDPETYGPLLEDARIRYAEQLR